MSAAAEQFSEGEMVERSKLLQHFQAGLAQVSLIIAVGLPADMQGISHLLLCQIPFCPQGIETGAQ